MEVAKKLFDNASFSKMSAAGILREEEHLELLGGRIVLFSAQGVQRRFTIEEYYKLVDVGLLDADERVELIEGEIVPMSPRGTRHTFIINRGNALMLSLLGQRGVVSVQNSVWLPDDSAPEPDFAILKPRDDYATHHPSGEDVLFLIEVSDPTVMSDRRVKIPLYAKGGIPQVLLIDIPGKGVENYTEPRDGRFTNVQRLTTGRVRLVEFEDVSIEVSELLGE
jgi:Uma2 family endonuclease